MNFHLVSVKHLRLRPSCSCVAECELVLKVWGAASLKCRLNSTVLELFVLLVCNQDVDSFFFIVTSDLLLIIITVHVGNAASLSHFRVSLLSLSSSSWTL